MKGEQEYGVPDDENPEWTAEEIRTGKPFAEVFPDLAEVPYPASSECGIHIPTSPPRPGAGTYDPPPDYQVDTDTPTPSTGADPLIPRPVRPRSE